MQVFEVLQLTEFPYMKTEEIIQGNIVKDIIKDDKAYLLVDHDNKRILTYFGPKSTFIMQFYGGILAGKLREQLKMFYRIFSLNLYSKKDKQFQEVMEKPLGGGRARPIEKGDFSATTHSSMGGDLTVHAGLKASDAMEYINELPKPENFLRKFILIAGSVYSDEEITKAFVKNDETVINQIKMGELNRGFTFFEGDNFSTRLIIKDRKVQGLEIYVHKDDKIPLLELNTPIIYEKRFNQVGNLENILEKFQIPDKLPEEGQDKS